MKSFVNIDETCFLDFFACQVYNQGMRNMQILWGILFNANLCTLSALEKN